MLEKELIAQLTSFLDEKMGLHYPKERWNDLEKKIIQISHEEGFKDPEQCIRWLVKDPFDNQKLKLLAFHLTIGETYFFRDSNIFEILEKDILPQIIENHKRDQIIRIWSAACCSGEETYSIAILLNRLIPNLKEWDVTLIGSDINHEFLKKAQKGCYKKWSFRATPKEIQDKYFEKAEDGTFHIIPSIRKLVKFIPFNLVLDPYPDISKGIYEMDLIFCHNVLIYFSKKQIKQTVHKLTGSLTNQGWLSVTSVEIPFIQEKFLIPKKFQRTTFFQKDISNEGSQNIPQMQPVGKKKVESKKLKILEKIPVSIPKKIEKKETPDKEGIFNHCLDLYQKKQYQEVISLLFPMIKENENNDSFLKTKQKEIYLLIKTFANQGNLNDATLLVEREMKLDKLNPPLHYIHATLLQAEGNIQEAIKSLKKALFLDPNYIIAYFTLGVLEKQIGNTQSATRNFTTALDLIDTLPASEEMVPETEGLTKSYLRDLIVNNIKA